MASTSRPTRRSTSARVRTVVVLPVPPFRERTAIVSAMSGRDCSEELEPGSGRRRLEGASRGLLVPDGGRRGRAARADGGAVQEVDGVAADGDLVGGSGRRPLHPPPVPVPAV